MQKLTHRLRLPDGTLIEFFAYAEADQMTAAEFSALCLSAIENERPKQKTKRRNPRKQKRQQIKVARRKNRG